VIENEPSKLPLAENVLKETSIVSHHLKRNSKLATIEAARTLFFIVISLGILKSLELFSIDWPPSTMRLPPVGWSLPMRVVVGLAYLVTVLRFSHGVSHLLALEKDCVETSGLPSSFRILKLFIFLSVLGILLYLMADDITNKGFFFWTAIMLGVDLVFIFFSKVVRAPLTSLFRWIPGRILIIRREQERKRRDAETSSDLKGASEASRDGVVSRPANTGTDERSEIESRWINTTPGYAADAVLEWMLSDLVVIVFCVLFYTIWQNVHYREYWFAAILLLAAVVDYAVNRQFYFGGWRDRRKEKIIFVCSPYAGGSPKDNNEREIYYRENIRKAQFYCRELMKKPGLIPFASHCFYPYFLNYDKPKDAVLARYCSLAFLRACDEVYVYVRHEPQPLVDLPLLRNIKVNTPDLKALKPSYGIKQKLAEARKLGLRIRYQPAIDELEGPKIDWTPNSLACSKKEIKQDQLERMKRVYVCTELRGVGWKDDMDIGEKRRRLKENIKLALWQCFKLIEKSNGSIAPFAPQAFYPYFSDVLGDKKKWKDWFERSLEVLKICDALYVYTKNGLPRAEELSKGMTHLIELAEELGMEIQYRPLAKEPQTGWNPSPPTDENLAKITDNMPQTAVPPERLKGVVIDGGGGSATPPTGPASAPNDQKN
jgi:hypothetical protein